MVLEGVCLVKNVPDRRRSTRPCSLDQPEGYDFFLSVQEITREHAWAEVDYPGLLVLRGAEGGCGRELVNAVIDDHLLP